MADPRGRGFNRGKGKWHMQQPKTHIESPADFGWQYLGDNGQGRVIWGREGKHLCYVLERDAFAVVDAETGQGDIYPDWTLAEITADVFPERGNIPFNGEPVVVEDDNGNGLKAGIDY